MKKLLQSILQRLLGFERYLFVFSRFKIATLKWDQKEGDFNYFMSMLADDAVVLDIGANIGIMTGLLARNCPKGHIHAFEPIPENFRAMERVVRSLRAKHVSTYQMALGADIREVEMLMPVMQGVRMQGLSHVQHETIEGFEVEQCRYVVQQKPLDAFDFWQKGPVHAIKMDVENYEQFVLQGAKQLLTTHHPIIYTELWDNANRENCFALLQSLGYEICVLVNEQLEVFQPAIHDHQNFFFVAPEE